MKRLMVRKAAAAFFYSTMMAAGGAQIAAADIVVWTGTGDFAEANIKAYIEPFEKATGIKVTAYKNGNSSLSELRLRAQSGNSDVDVWALDGASITVARENNWIAPIDYSVFPKEQLDQYFPTSRKSHGVGALFYSVAMSYNAAAFKDKPVPSNWQEFWDVKNFPAARTLREGSWTGSVWEIALMADGVKPENLYPLDVERALKSLDKIKPHVKAWWKNGSDNQQIFADRIVDIGPAFDGRMANLRKNGIDMRIVWNGGLLLQDYWAVDKNSKHKNEAMRFIAFATSAKQQAEYTKMIPYGPSNKAAFALLDESHAKLLSSYPANYSIQVPVDYEYYSAKNANGKPNNQVLAETFAAWAIK